MNSHILFPDSTTIWADGSQILTGDPMELLDYVKDAPVATFKHPERNCIYQEVEACVRLRKDNPTLMRKQVEGYQSVWRHPAYAGLVETACVVRVATPKVAEFNKLWWAEIDRHSYRDQLSFNPVAWKLGIRVNHIPGCRAQSPYFKFVPHKG